jgi:hypothetical protein
MRTLLPLALVLALVAPEAASAHGLGGVRDLPIPQWLFFYGGALVLVLSFAALGVLWRRPRLDPDAPGRPLPPVLQHLLLSPALRVGLGALSLVLLGVVFLAAAIGDPAPARNLAPTFVYVVFWLGLVPLVVLLGDVWSALNPWKAAADLVAWLAARSGRSWDPPADYPPWLGRWPAAALLFAFASLELAYSDPSDPRALALAIVLYSVITWLGMATFGRAAWLAGGEGFSVYFGLLARISPFAVREDERGRAVVLRAPLTGLTAGDARPGTLAFVAVMLGSVAFDGFSRTSFWQDRLYSVQAPLVSDDPRLADLLGSLLNLAGLAVAVAAVAAAYLTAVAAAQAVGRSEASLPAAFLGSLIPIALVYAVAHYFSLFVLQGQFAIPLASDPFGLGWDLLGTTDFRPNLNVLSPNTIWYVQVAALVLGHVVGLVVAHDRAVALFRSARTALQTQYAMLALMVLYTVGGLWLLSSG